MIGPDEFAEFVLPDIETQCKKLDYAVYHLDGPDQLPHLDMLLDIPDLRAIQWVPGSGNPQNEDPRWFPLYEKILGKGKGLILQCWDDYTNIPKTLEAIPKAGVLCSAWMPTKESGQALLHAVPGRPREL